MNKKSTLKRLMICAGVTLTLSGVSTSALAQGPYIGEIKWVGFDYCPRGWAKANGSLVSPASNPALFSLLGTRYGGDGRATFALPDLRGRVMVGAGSGPGLTPRKLGQKTGREVVSLTTSQLPTHAHDAATKTVLRAYAGPADSGFATQNPLATSTSEIYAGGNVRADVSMASSSAISTTTVDANGGGAPFHVEQPSLVLTPCIAVAGTFPSK